MLSAAFLRSPIPALPSPKSVGEGRENTSDKHIILPSPAIGSPTGVLREGAGGEGKVNVLSFPDTFCMHVARRIKPSQGF